MGAKLDRVLFSSSGKTIGRDAMATPYIGYENAEVRYTELVYGLRDATLKLERGEFVFFVGRTGAGKSTLLKLLTREVRNTAGKVYFNLHTAANPKGAVVSESAEEAVAAVRSPAIRSRSTSRRASWFARCPCT